MAEAAKGVQVKTVQVPALPLCILSFSTVDFPTRGLFFTGRPHLVTWLMEVPQKAEQTLRSFCLHKHKTKALLISANCTDEHIFWLIYQICRMGKQRSAVCITTPLKPLWAQQVLTLLSSLVGLPYSGSASSCLKVWLIRYLWGNCKRKTSAKIVFILETMA